MVERFAMTSWSKVPLSTDSVTLTLLASSLTKYTVLLNPIVTAEVVNVNA